MRKIGIESWKALVPETDEEGKIIGKKMGEENLLMVLTVLVNNKKPEEIPRGLDKFRLYSRLKKAFDKAEKDNVLTLEETEYKFLKDTIERDIPSIWGTNENMAKAVENFLEAKEE